MYRRWIRNCILVIFTLKTILLLRINDVQISMPILKSCKLSENPIFLTIILKHFSKNRPLGRFFHRVVMSMYVYVLRFSGKSYFWLFWLFFPIKLTWTYLKHIWSIMCFLMINQEDLNHRNIKPLIKCWKPWKLGIFQKIWRRWRRLNTPYTLYTNYHFYS